MNPLLIAALSVLAIGCKSTGQAVGTQPSGAKPVALEAQEGPYELASIQRTACFGRCPIYKTTFMSNGEATFVGRMFVDSIGTYAFLLTPEDMEAIREQAQLYGIFDMQDEYPTMISDFPTVITTVNINGRRKRILNGENAPGGLRGFERFLDSLLEGKELRKVSDSTSY